MPEINAELRRDLRELVPVAKHAIRWIPSGMHTVLSRSIEALEQWLDDPSHDNMNRIILEKNITGDLFGSGEFEESRNITGAIFALLLAAVDGEAHWLDDAKRSIDAVYHEESRVITRDLAHCDSLNEIMRLRDRAIAWKLWRQE